ncbi:6996_t:CDS:1 [Funneliformis mosseae]|uniref:6996_t:CDS:1 n=1 Tax=Funneliformis mosseae TaxID=27381 RepID=A0A9N9AYG8_FUNMO|nr:6996_t:CDS:1 [Funneliformis mosseae]
MAQDSISSTNSLILQAIVGMLIGILGIFVGVCCSFYCLRKQGYTFPTDYKLMGRGKNIVVPKGAEKRKPPRIPSLHFDNDNDEYLTSNPSEQIVIVRHGSAADFPETAESFQDLSLSVPHAVYGSASASASMTNIASAQQKSARSSDNESQEMTRSHSR